MRRSKAAIERRVPTNVQNWFENPPLLKTEDPRTYQDLRCAIEHDIKPASVVDWLLMNDVVYLTWDIRRLRAFKTHIIEQGRDRALPMISIETGTEAESAHVFKNNIEHLERIDRLLESAERGRNNTLREIEFRIPAAVCELPHIPLCELLHIRCKLAKLGLAGV